jgi:hypothetical protein
MKALTLFEDLPAPPRDCTKGHLEEKALYIWPGETVERMVWRCTRCGAMRGRC